MACLNTCCIVKLSWQVHSKFRNCLNNFALVWKSPTSTKVINFRKLLVVVHQVKIYFFLSQKSIVINNMASMKSFRMLSLPKLIPEICRMNNAINSRGLKRLNWTLFRSLNANSWVCIVQEPMSLTTTYAMPKWSVLIGHLTCNIQSEYFISTQCSYAPITFCSWHWLQATGEGGPIKSNPADVKLLQS